MILWLHHSYIHDTNDKDVQVILQLIYTGSDIISHTSVGKETGTLSELLAQAPALSTLMFTMSEERERQGNGCHVSLVVTVYILREQEALLVLSLSCLLYTSDAADE